MATPGAAWYDYSNITMACSCTGARIPPAILVTTNLNENASKLDVKRKLSIPFK